MNKSIVSVLAIATVIGTAVPAAAVHEVCGENSLQACQQTVFEEVGEINDMLEEEFQHLMWFIVNTWRDITEDGVQIGNVESGALPIV